MTNPEVPKTKKDLEKQEESPKVPPEKAEEATKLSERAEKLAEQGYKERDEQKIQEARKILAKAYEILEGKEKEEVEEILEGREDKEILEKLFIEQKHKLLDLGYPEALKMDKDSFSAKYIEPLRKELGKIPENIPEGNLPFLIVIPDNILDIKKKMSMVKLGQETGYVWKDFDFKELRDAEGVKTPEDPYLIFDIENGDKMKGKSADDCVKQFAKENRRGLTTQEGIDLITHHPEILQDHCVDLVGSRSGSENVPYLWLHDGCPKLNRDWTGNAIRVGGRLPAVVFRFLVLGNLVLLDSWITLCCLFFLAAKPKFDFLSLVGYCRNHNALKIQNRIVKNYLEI